MPPTFLLSFLLSFFLDSFAGAEIYCDRKSLKACAEDIVHTSQAKIGEWGIAKITPPGSLKITRSNKTFTARRSSLLHEGDTLEGSGVLVIESDLKPLVVQGSYRIVVGVKKENAVQRELRLIAGFVFWKARGCKEVPCEREALTTPTSSVGIRGTEFTVEVENQKEVFVLFDGEIAVTREGRKEVLSQPGKLVWHVGEEPVRIPIDENDQKRRESLSKLR